MSVSPPVTSFQSKVAQVITYPQLAILVTSRSLPVIKSKLFDLVEVVGMRALSYGKLHNGSPRQRALMTGYITARYVLEYQYIAPFC